MSNNFDKYKENPKIAPFLTHGFDIVGESGNQIFGNCVFCANEQKFYINPTSGQFDCKVCGESGNIFNFLQKLAEVRLESTKRQHYNKLKTLRGLPIEAFKAWDVAWDDLMERWLIPCWSEKSTVRDIRYWLPPKGKRKGLMKTTKGCKAQLLGVKHLVEADPGSTVWVCEGEWDAMALCWLLMNCPDIDDNWVVVSVPGANVFKEDWLAYFKGHRVVLAFDNDEAGQKGRLRTGKLLKGIARTLETIEWPEGTKDRWDVRDHVLAGIEAKTEPVVILCDLQALVAAFDPVETQGDESAASGQEIVAVGSIPVDQLPSFEATLKIYRKHIEMTPEMEDALAIMFAVALANGVPGDQLWGFMVGPPGSGKTLLLRSLSGSERCLFNSSLTPHSLVSGFRSERDPSLLPQWNDKCAVLKDFTEVLATHPQAKDELYGVLRGAYDGQVYRPFGNGVVREYNNLSFSMLAGVTPAIHGDRNATMGERFFKYEMMKGQDWDADAEIYAAINCISHEQEIGDALAYAAGRFLSREVDPRALPDVPQWVKDRMVALAQLIAALRANVDREVYGEQRMKYRPVREVGTRLAKQLVKLGQMLSLVYGLPEIDARVYALMERVAFDTAVGFHLDVVQALVEAGGKAIRKDLAERLQLPETTLARALEDLHALEIVQRGVLKVQLSGRGRPSVEWNVTSRINSLWERAQIGK